MRNFDASTGEKFVQSNDKTSGMPLWVIEVIDGDPAARVRAVKVKVAAQVQPVVPAGRPPRSPFVPVEFAGLTVTSTSTRPGGWPTSLGDRMHHRVAGARAGDRGSRGVWKSSEVRPGTSSPVVDQPTGGVPRTYDATPRSSTSVRVDDVAIFVATDSPPTPAIEVRPGAGRQVTKFAAEVERLHARHPGPDGQASGCGAGAGEAA